jgi:hypothetical protein
MLGFPKWINTKADVQYVLTAYPAQMRAKLQEWLDTRFVWQAIGELTTEQGLTDDTHKVVDEPQDDGSIRRYQYALIEDPHATIYRLGLTVDEVVSLIGQGH